MKPVSLLLENFRSYRQHDAIEFGDSQLVALVGPTGAGKSSILDAMVYALYGKRADVGQMQDDLVAHNERGMSVRFRFSIAGQAYEVYRQRRNGQALQRLTMPNGTAHVDRSEVDEKIQALLGLTLDAFLKTVLLPQGQFAQLLLDTGGNRAKILAQVMGLTYFNALNTNAKGERDRAAAVKLANDGARSTLPLSPTTDLVEAEKQLITAHALVVHLASSLELMRATDAEIAVCDASIRALDASLAPFSSAPAFQKMLEKVRIRARELTPGIIVATTEVTKAEEHRVVSASVVNSRRKAGLDGSTLSSIRERLLRLDSCQTERLAEQERHDSNARNLQTSRKASIAAEQRLSKADAELQPLIEARTAALAAREAAAVSLRALRDAIAERQRRTTVLVDEQAAHTRCAAAVSAATAADEAAGKAHTAARTALEVAREAVSAAEQADAAAFVGSHLHVGDTCPVCTAKVPKTFKPRDAVDLTAASKRQKLADTAEQKAAGLRNGTQAKLQSTSDALAEQTTRLAKAKSEVSVLDAKLKAICGKLSPQLKVDELTSAVAAAEAVVTAAQSKVSKVEQELALAKQAQDSEREQHDALKTKVTVAVAELKRRDTEISSLLKLLPSPWTPGQASPIATILERVSEERKFSDAAEAELRKAEAAKSVAMEHGADLEREFEKEVNRPLRSLQDQAKAFAQALGHAAPSSDLSVDDGYFETLLAGVADNQTSADASRAELVANRANLQERQKQLTEPVGGDIIGRHATASAEAARIDERIVALRTQVDQVQRVEQTLAAVRPIHDALDGIAKATALNQFPEHLTNQYIIRLLGLASDYFLEMTGRFRFVPPRSEGRAADRELRILDTTSAATMPPENLSGGEKFLASLALSLAVVDQAALAGAKIDSLFLDEGFGSLDSEFLDKAMMELRARARKGRTIWIITHLREAARYADITYLVEKGPNGSSIRLNDSDLDEPVDAAGLLSVMT